MAGRSKVPLTWGVEHDEHRGVFLHKLVKVFIAQVINGAALICPGSLGDLGLWRLRTGRPKTGRAQSTRRGRCSPHPHWLSQPASGAPRNLSRGAGVGGTPRPCPPPSSPQEPRGAQLISSGKQRLPAVALQAVQETSLPPWDQGGVGGFVSI